MSSLSKNTGSTRLFSSDERIGQALKTIQRKHGKRAIRFGREGVAHALAVFGKRPDPPQKTDGAA